MSKIKIYKYLSFFRGVIVKTVDSGLKKCGTRVQTPVVPLRSLSDKYPRERYEPPYTPIFGLNSTITVLQDEFGLYNPRWLICH